MSDGQKEQVGPAILVCLRCLATSVPHDDRPAGEWWSRGTWRCRDGHDAVVYVPAVWTEQELGDARQRAAKAAQIFEPSASKS